MKKYSPYEIFVFVVEYQGITGAAERTGVTKAAISKTIRSIELEAGIDFFDRQHRALQLTTTGKAFYAHCKRIQKELLDARSFIQGMHQRPEGELVVAVPHYMASHRILPRLALFYQQCPDLKVVLHTQEKQYHFRDDSVDIAFGFNHLPNDEDIITKRIDTTRYVFCASPHYLKQHGTPQTLNDLSHHSYIGHTMRPVGKELALKPGYNATINERFATNTSVDLIHFALQSMGIIQVQDFMVHPYLERGELIELLNGVSRDEVPLYLYYKRFRYTQPKVRAFIDFYCP